MYFSTLVVAETFGQSNVSRIVDINADSGNIYHPAYIVYENDAPTRAVLFNYVTDATGASDLAVSLNIDGATLPDTVYVRYFSADSTAEKDNITWAGMNMGSAYNSDGRLYGDEVTEQVTCSEGTCIINVPAPSIALVFFSDSSLTESSVADDATATYGTTVIGTGSATIDPEVIETSNGQEGGVLGSTSKGSSKSAASRRTQLPGTSASALALISFTIFIYLATLI